ncbi:hypothetical protein [Butyrivibrio sp. FCS014]|uniref:hypothetical protein n=1 Tax=Butyrivibrio sp. FCS014 TaxID=1408304 RepID=UPI0004674C68|nr:hypothetical protein [Butyrivibrio sp. FCS014]
MVGEKINITDLNIEYLSQLEDGKLNDLYNTARKECTSLKGKITIDNIRDLSATDIWNARKLYGVIAFFLFFLGATVYSLGFILGSVKGPHPVLQVPVMALSYVVQVAFFMFWIWLTWYKIIKEKLDCFGSAIVWWIGDFLAIIMAVSALFRFSGGATLFKNETLSFPIYLLTFLGGLALVAAIYFAWRIFQVKTIIGIGKKKQQ